MKHLILPILVLVCGCTPPSKSQTTKMDLASIAMQYHQYVSESDSPPDKLETLANFNDPFSDLPANKAQSETMKQALASGEYVVSWGYDVTANLPRNSSVILAYHKDVPTKGGFVAFADASVRSLTKEEFEKHSKAAETSNQ